MMFDHLETTQKQLVAQVKAACKALKFIRSVTAEDTLPRRPDGSTNPRYTEWCKQMGILNTARVDIQMAGEYLRDELSTENEDKCIAWKRIEKQLKRKKKKKSHLETQQADAEEEEDEPEWKGYSELDEETGMWR